MKRQVFVLLLLFATCTTVAFANSNSGWVFKGNGLSNTMSTNSQLNSTNIQSLKFEWKYDTAPFPASAANSADFLNSLPPAGIRQPAAVENGVVYITDTIGNLTALRQNDGTVLWQKNFGMDLSRPGRGITASENTPAISGNFLIVGNHIYNNERFCTAQSLPGDICNPGDGAVIVAVDKNDGHFLWSKQVDPHPFAKIMSSPVIYNNTIYVSVTSWEEFGATLFPAELNDPNSQNPYPCCSFRGSVLAMDLNTGAIKWQTYLSPGLAPPNASSKIKNLFGVKGFFGVTSYHPPVIDPKRGQLYVGTGNNYVSSDFSQQCERDRRDGAKPDPSCNNLSKTVRNYNDSVVALNMSTGKVKWFYQFLAYDTEVHDCGAVDLGGGGFAAPLVVPLPLANASNCPQVIGPNNGVGGGVMLITPTQQGGNSQGSDLVVATTKGDVTFALNPDDGGLVWSTLYGPAGNTGTFNTNHSFASDGKRIFTGSFNLFNTGRDRQLPFVPMKAFLDNNGFTALGIRTNQDPPFEKPAPGPFAFGFPFLPIISTFPNSQGYTNPPISPFTIGPASGPKAIQVLINPPSDTVALVDGINVFTNAVDSRCPVNRLCTISGFITALDTNSGKVLWQRPATDGVKGFLGPAGVTGSLVVTNDILLAAYEDGHGTLVALDTATGRKLFQAQNQSTFYNTTTQTEETIDHGYSTDGLSVVGSRVYWGLGFLLDYAVPNSKGNRLNVYGIEN